MIEMIKFVQSFSNPFLDRFFELVTMMGEETFIILVVALILWCIHKDFGYRLGFAYLSNGIINIALKDIFRIPRIIGHPGIRSLRLETAGGYSFPSGHTQFTASIWTSLMTQCRRKWIYAAGIFMIVLIALSRVYLGVHTPIDVVGGGMIGVVWVFAANRIFDRAKKTGKGAFLLVFVIPMLVGLFFFPDNYYYKVAGTVVGFFMGYMIEQKYINYQVNAPFLIQAAKFLLGIAGVVLLKSVIKSLLPQALFSDFFRYVLVALWMTAGAPFLFTTVLKVPAGATSRKAAG